MMGDDQGASKAPAQVHVRDAKTHEPVTERMLAERSAP